jgi:hypothetical protein
MVVPSFVRKTYLVLPSPLKTVIRVALPRHFRVSRPQTDKANPSLLKQVDRLGDTVFGPLWKE